VHLSKFFVCLLFFVLLSACSKASIKQEINSHDYRVWVTPDYAPDNKFSGRLVYISSTTLELLNPIAKQKE